MRDDARCVALLAQPPREIGAGAPRALEQLERRLTRGGGICRSLLGERGAGTFEKRHLTRLPPRQQDQARRGKRRPLPGPTRPDGQAVQIAPSQDSARFLSVFGFGLGCGGFNPFGGSPSPPFSTLGSGTRRGPGLRVFGGFIGLISHSNKLHVLDSSTFCDQKPLTIDRSRAAVLCDPTRLSQEE